MPVRASTALALLIALILPASAAGAVKTGFDRHAGMRLTLDGRVLTAKFANPRGGDLDLEEHLYGKRIDAVCASSFLFPRGAKVVRRQRWPVGTRRMSFRFGRDISRSARWCLIEHRAADVAAVSFIEREPIRFVGKGRGPSGAWWRLGGGTGELAEPCALLRTESFKAPWCFRELAERRVTLAVQQWPPGCAEDGYVIGVVTPAAATVRLLMSDGTTADARLFDAPRGSRLRARFFSPRWLGRRSPAPCRRWTRRAPFWPRAARPTTPSSPAPRTCARRPGRRRVGVRPLESGGLRTSARRPGRRPSGAAGSRCRPRRARRGSGPLR